MIKIYNLGINGFREHAGSNFKQKWTTRCSFKNSIKADEVSFEIYNGKIGEIIQNYLEKFFRYSFPGKFWKLMIGIWLLSMTFLVKHELIKFCWKIVKEKEIHKDILVDIFAKGIFNVDKSFRGGVSYKRIWTQFVNSIGTTFP